MIKMVCDKCGKLYERYGEPAQSLADRVELNTVVLGFKSYGYSGENIMFRKDYDLCSDCMEKIKLFLKEGADNA
jgi:hypothetical protein